MIAELTAAMTAIRETAQLAKVLNDAKTQTEINAAVGELNSKLASIQRECVSLVELVGAYQESNASLKAKIAEFEDFKTQTEGYALNQLDFGSFVYSKKEVVGDKEVEVHLCPQCFTKRQISILQPTGEASYNSHTTKWYFQSRCHSCESLFSMNISNYSPGRWN